MNAEINKFNNIINKNCNVNFLSNEKVTLANKDLAVYDRHKRLINSYYRIRSLKNIPRDT